MITKVTVDSNIQARESNSSQSIRKVIGDRY